MRDSSLAHWLFYILPMFRLLDFLLGIAIGIWFINKTKKANQPNKLIMTSLEILAVVLLVLFFYFHQNVHQTLRLWGYYQPVMVFLIIVFAFQKGYISKVMSNKYLIYLGEISFSFYMIHQLLLRYFIHIPLLNNKPVLYSIVCLFITLIVSHFIYKYYEIPMKNKIRKSQFLS